MKKIKYGLIACFQSVILLFLIFLFLASCEKANVKNVNRILGNYYTERFDCPSGATIYDSFSTSTIRKSTNNVKNGIEISFLSTRGAIWYGQVKGDSLIFQKQVVNSTNLEYDKGGIEIKGFGVVRGSTIEYTIEEYYIFNGYRHTCTFIAVKK